MDQFQQQQVNQASVSLSASAVKKVKEMMARDNKEGCGLRVGVVTGGCAGFSYDLRFQQNPYDNDIVLEQHGLKIFINPGTLQLLQGVTIDYIDTLKESGFKYINPNAKTSCGCGVSFS
jgi:iron-sulfur cluster assembly accessory protein